MNKLWIIRAKYLDQLQNNRKLKKIIENIICLESVFASTLFLYFISGAFISTFFIHLLVSVGIPLVIFGNSLIITKFLDHQYKKLNQKIVKIDQEIEFQKEIVNQNNNIHNVQKSKFIVKKNDVEDKIENLKRFREICLEREQGEVESKKYK